MLPEWATLKVDADENPITNRGGMPIIDVDADAMYTAFLEELEVEEPDQYWLEVCYQMMKLEIQRHRILAGLKGDEIFQFEIHVHDPGKKWAQAKHPKGDGAEAASKGLKAREHFKQLRGFVPGA